MISCELGLKFHRDRQYQGSSSFHTYLVHRSALRYTVLLTRTWSRIRAQKIYILLIRGRPVQGFFRCRWVSLLRCAALSGSNFNQRAKCFVHVFASITGVR